MRGLLVALFMGLAGHAAVADPPKPPKPSTTAEQTAPQEKIEAPAPPIDEAVNPGQYTSPCAEGQENRDSDLCAQWKAADAATEAASWSYAQIWIGIVGLVLGFITMGAAVAAALFAKAAADHTKTGSEAAISSANAATVANNVAEMRWIADNRPWLLLERDPAIKLYSSDGDFMNLSVDVNVKNVGKTPAFNAEVGMKLVRSSIGIDSSEQIEAYAAELIGPKAWRYSNNIVMPERPEVLHGMTEDIPEIGPNDNYFNIYVCVTYRAKGNPNVFHVAAALSMSKDSIKPTILPNVKGGIATENIRVNRIRGCNSVG